MQQTIFSCSVSIACKVYLLPNLCFRKNAQARKASLLQINRPRCASVFIFLILPISRIAMILHRIQKLTKKGFIRVFVRGIYDSTISEIFNKLFSSFEYKVESSGVLILSLFFIIVFCVILHLLNYNMSLHLSFVPAY